jgi:YjbE family integral membrane protein
VPRSDSPQGSFDLPELISIEVLTAFMQVVLIDVALAGDNAIVIALAARGLPKAQKGKAIFVGIAAATVLRIAFALVTVQLLNVVGLLLAGGLLLLWVCWKMWRELHPARMYAQDGTRQTAPEAPPPQAKTFSQAALQIIVADVSMSLDNVLAVAGAAREHPAVLVFGLILSVAMMGFAAVLISRFLERHRWLAYLGLAVVLYVALEMIYAGSTQVWPMVEQAVVG